MNSCKDSDESAIGNDTPLIVQKSDLVFLGCTVPFSIQENETPPSHSLGLSPYARIFAFNENIRYGSKFLELLKGSEETDIPVRVYVYPNTSEIYWVEKASDEEIKKYEETKIPPVN